MGFGTKDRILESIEEPARKTPVRHSVDVLIVGGGSAGLAAATSASRMGANVLLVERNGYLGGTLTMVTLGSICGLFTVTDEAVTPVVRGIAGELVERLQSMGGAKAPMRWMKTASLPYDPTAMKLVSDEIVTEAGVRLAFHCTAVAVHKQGNRVQGVIFEGRDGRWACMAKVVVDCTGDGDIAALAGVGFEHDPVNNQAPTTMFRFGGVDVARATQITRDQLRSHLEKAVAAGLDLPRTTGGAFSTQPYSMHLNITRVLSNGRAPDPLNTDELTQAELEGRRQLKMYLQAFRKFVPGYENCYIADIGAYVGIRESRRILGRYRLSLDDVLGEGRFEDSIACSAWPVEEHGAGRVTKWVFLEPGTYYQLPYRMMLPRDVEGLIVAGRCSSATHDAHASMRVAAVCMALGEAAGVAAARASDRDEKLDAIDINALRNQLLKQGAFLGAEADKNRTQSRQSKGNAQ